MHILLLIGAVVCLVVFAFWCLRHRSPVDLNETVITFTGGLGSGKTADGVHYVRKADKMLCKVAKKNKAPKPEVYSNIPIKLGFRRYSKVLTRDILLLKVRIPRYSVVFIDEIGSFCSQFNYKGANVDKFDEFVRFFRHYVRGVLVCTDQCSENIVLTVRRRMNYVFNLRKFRKFPIIPFCTVDCRVLSVSEEIKSVVEKSEEENFTDGYKRFFFFGNPFKHYDSYCYSVRYDPLPEVQSEDHEGLKTSKLLKIDE